MRRNVLSARELGCGKPSVAFSTGRQPCSAAMFQRWHCPRARSSPGAMSCHGAPSSNGSRSLCVVISLASRSWVGRKTSTGAADVAASRHRHISPLGWRRALGARPAASPFHLSMDACNVIDWTRLWALTTRHVLSNRFPHLSFDQVRSLLVLSIFNTSRSNCTSRPARHLDILSATDRM